ncbi:MAG: sugar ABC transporter permease [Chloroflexi bacterium]|nr:sugar ABC transporter permease [Chloroflexota bacterium]
MDRSLTAAPGYVEAAPAPLSLAEVARARRRRRVLITGYLYLLPAAILTGIFVYWPLVASGILSFYEWNLVSPAWVSVGWQNYLELFWSRAFWLAVINTGKAAGALTLFTVLIPLVLAVLVLRASPRLQTICRVVLFSPAVISMAIACAIWLWMYHPLYGVLNSTLRLVGIEGPRWLSSGDWAIWGIINVTVWKTLGFNFVVFLAGLLAIPREMQEAARVDGASEWRVFRHVTWPILAPTTLFVFLTTFILAPQNLFVPTQILTHGGPNEASNNLGYLVYQLGFEYFRAGYASAAAMVIFLIFLGLTFLQFTLAERRVHYGG